MSQMERELHKAANKLGLKRQTDPDAPTPQQQEVAEKQEKIRKGISIKQ